MDTVIPRVDLWPFGLHSTGMHFWILDEALMGKRVAHCLDNENNAGWSALMDLSYEQYCREQERDGRIPDPADPDDVPGAAAVPRRATQPDQVDPLG
jgi:hypothetical protein